MINKTSTRRRLAAVASGALVAGGLAVAPAIAGLSAASAEPTSIDYHCQVQVPDLGMNTPAEAVVQLEVTAPEEVAPGSTFPVDIVGSLDMGSLNFPVTEITGTWDIPLTVGDQTTTVTLPSTWKAPGSVAFPFSGTKNVKAPTTLGENAITVGTITGHLTAVGYAVNAPCTSNEGEDTRVGTAVVSEDAPTAVPVTGAVKIAGKPKVGKTLKAVPGTSDGATITYQWLANGKPISKATKSSLKLSKSLKGKKVSVRATYGKDGFLETVQTSKAVKVKK